MWTANVLSVSAKLPMQRFGLICLQCILEEGAKQMGFDVHGRAPSSEVGTYFRNNVWYWRPLANYISEVAPSLYTDKVWQYNDGKGLNAADAAKLALILETELKSG